MVRQKFVRARLGLRTEERVDPALPPHGLRVDPLDFRQPVGLSGRSRSPRTRKLEADEERLRNRHQHCPRHEHGALCAYPGSRRRHLTATPLTQVSASTLPHHTFCREIMAPRALNGPGRYFHCGMATVSDEGTLPTGICLREGGGWGQ